MEHLSGKHIKGYFKIDFLDNINQMIFGKAVVWRPACGPHSSYFVDAELLRLNMNVAQVETFEIMMELGSVVRNSIILVTYTDVGIPPFGAGHQAKLVEVNNWDVKA